MENIILCAKDGRPSMKNVYSKMDGGQLIVRRKPRRGSLYYRQYTNNNVGSLQRVNNPNFQQTRVIIRWGTQEQINHKPGAIIYNKASVLALVSNKYRSRLKLAEAGVNVPLNVTAQTPESAITYPVIARPHHHSKGRNFVTLANRSEFLRHYRNNHTNWYYSNFINKVREFRVHCCHGKVINLLEKPNPGGNQIAWNRAQNHSAFTSINWQNYNVRVVLEALKACKALGADFLGVDVVLDRHGVAWVLEGNSSPTLASSEYSCERYAKYFSWLMRSPERRDHWDFTKFTNPESFAWKNFQLQS